MLSHDIEPLFDDLTEQRITLLSGQCRGELGPVLGLQSLDRGRKEVPLLHRHMAALVPNEVANDAINSLPGNDPVGKYGLDRLRNLAQTFSAAPVLGGKIGDDYRRGKVARCQFPEDYVLLLMVV